MSNEFKPLKWDEIISIDKSTKILIPHPTFKVSELIKAVMEFLKSKDNVTSYDWTEEKAKWAGDGVRAEVLKYGAKGWQKGKVRLTIEFIPDEPETEEAPASDRAESNQPESPLDDLRKILNENS